MSIQEETKDVILESARVVCSDGGDMGRGNYTFRADDPECDIKILAAARALSSAMTVLAVEIEGRNVEQILRRVEALPGFPREHVEFYSSGTCPDCEAPDRVFPIYAAQGGLTAKKAVYLVRK